MFVLYEGNSLPYIQKGRNPESESPILAGVRVEAEMQFLVGIGVKDEVSFFELRIPV